MDGALRVPVPVPLDGVRGVGVLECVARLVAMEARAPPGAAAEDVDVDFEGEAGVFACLGGAVDGRAVGTDVRGLIDGAAEVGVGAGAGAGAEAGAGAGDVAGAVVSCVMVDPWSGAARVALVVLVKGSGADARSGGGGAPSPDVRDACADAISRDVVVVVAATAADVEPVPFVLTGGHSRAMRCSSLTASPALLEVTLAARDDELGGVG